MTNKLSSFGNNRQWTMTHHLSTYPEMRHCIHFKCFHCKIIWGFHEFLSSNNSSIVYQNGNISHISLDFLSSLIHCFPVAAIKYITKCFATKIFNFLNCLLISCTVYVTTNDAWAESSKTTNIEIKYLLSPSTVRHIRQRVRNETLKY